MCIPQSSMTFLPAMETRIQLRPTSWPAPGHEGGVRGATTPLSYPSSLPTAASDSPSLKAKTWLPAPDPHWALWVLGLLDSSAGWGIWTSVWMTCEGKLPPAPHAGTGSAEVGVKVSSTASESSLVPSSTAPPAPDPATTAQGQMEEAPHWRWRAHPLEGKGLSNKCWISGPSTHWRQASPASLPTPSETSTGATYVLWGPLPRTCL